MHIHPGIEALRADRGLQRRLSAEVKEAEARWRALPQVQPLLRELARYGAGEALADCPALGKIVACPEHARAFVGGWCDALAALLASEPLAIPTHRHSHSRAHSTMQIAASGRASLSLVSYRPCDDLPPARTASFVDRELAEIVVAGEAEGVTVQIDRGFSVRECRWQEGDRLALGGPCQSRLVTRVPVSCAVLQLQRGSKHPAPTRIHDLSSGALVHQASGVKHASQLEMAITVLGAMERKDAAPALAAICEDDCQPAHLRWEALRNLLALDTGQGITCARSIARTANDELAVPAAALLARFGLDNAHEARDAA